MKKLLLNDNVTYCLVDNEDYEYLSQWTWRLNSSGYVSRNRNNKMHFMHRELMHYPEKGLTVDHKNRNKLDNQKSNLRVTSKSENAINKAPNRNNTSGIKGVYWDADRNKWNAQIANKNKVKHLGVFKTKLEAAVAYNNEAIKLYGSFAYLNDLERLK